ncbi:MAG: hypothetical protein WHV63_07125 [Ignavibacteria bacterium]|nr:hypothetical protein [Ignavibacteria bacterium]
MKNIITTVGTSLFTNYLKFNNNIKSYYDLLEKETYSNNSGKNFYDEKRKIKELVLPFAQNKRDSAELKSLEKLFLKFKEEQIIITFICSDSILSNLAAEIYSEILTDRNTKYPNFVVEVKIDYIKNLIPFDQKFVNEGLSQLIYKLEAICGGFYADKILNITGGFKGVIPYLTIWGQINKVPLYYIFEESEFLINIPQSPITIDYNLFEKYYEVFLELSESVEKPKDKYIKENNLFDDFPSDLLYEIENDGTSLLSLDPLGLIYWRHYQSKFFTFYAPREVLEEIENQPNVKRILATKFHNDIIRKNKTEQKGEHFVYDDGDNPNRIYYFESHRKIYIYKTFQSEELAKEFIKRSFSKDDIIQKSLKTKIEVKNV